MARKGFGSGKIENIKEASRATEDLLRDAFAETGYRYYYVSLKSIDCNEKNDYAETDTPEQIRALADDIRRQGLLHNIVLSKKENGRYLILSGERRYRAYCYLYETEQDAKWARIYSKVLEKLDEVQEMLILDAANLQTRGGVGNEQRFREATARFIQNLQKSGDLSQEEAIRLGRSFIGIEPETIRKNVAIETALLPQIREMLNSGLLPKAAAGDYARLPEAMQRQIAKNLKEAQAVGNRALQDENRRLENVIREQKRTIEELAAREKRMEELQTETKTVDQEMKKLQAQLKKGTNLEEAQVQVEAWKARKQQLAAQRKSYAAAIEKAQQLLKEQVHQLEKPVARRAVSGETAEQLNRAVTKAETAVHAVLSNTAMAKFRKLNADGRRVMRERMEDLYRQLGDALAQLQAMEKEEK